MRDRARARARSDPRGRIIVIQEKYNCRHMGLFGCCVCVCVCVCVFCVCVCVCVCVCKLLTVRVVTKRTTRTLRFCPTRCTRSIACAFVTYAHRVSHFFFFFLFSHWRCIACAFATYVHIRHKRTPQTFKYVTYAHVHKQIRACAFVTYVHIRHKRSNT